MLRSTKKKEQNIKTYPTYDFLVGGRRRRPEMTSDKVFMDVKMVK